MTASNEIHIYQERRWERTVPASLLRSWLAAERGTQPHLSAVAIKKESAEPTREASAELAIHRKRPGYRMGATADFPP